MNAQKDMVNANAATVLFGLLQKVKTPSEPAPEQKPAGQTPASMPAPASSSIGSVEGPVASDEAPVPTRPSPAFVEAETLGLKENMMLAGMCALVATAGIRHFVHA